ncbi:MAG: hypothetical protein EA369_06830 [Bradymonadales bacterium]|nr:MAG: hypothetical protein EA369_06830 [Bradymonadales bacterium]
MGHLHLGVLVLVVFSLVQGLFVQIEKQTRLQNEVRQSLTQVMAELSWSELDWVDLLRELETKDRLSLVEESLLQELRRISDHSTAGLQTP